MATANPRTRVSQFFNLDRDQSTLDFVDVPIGSDVPVFLDPSRLRSMESTWASECVALLQNYFGCVLRHLAAGDRVAGVSLLEALHERNEFHLGMSSGVSDGRAFGRGYAERVWAEMERSEARRSGLLEDLEDSCLFIEGIGPDRISDAACNILRGPLIAYTHQMCVYYGIPMANDVDSGPVWNAHAERWENSLIPLPVTPWGTLILVPKIAVRHRFVYNAVSYYTHYVLPAMRYTEKAMNTELVYTLKSGERRVSKDSLRDKYGANKLAIVEQTILHPDMLQRYRQDARRSSPITHIQLAAAENVDMPRFQAMLDAVTQLPVGRDSAAAYEDAIEKLLSALFFPSLSSPVKQHEIHGGRKRIDITYVNNPQNGFFRWVANSYPSSHIFVECKNYGREIGNPELDQLAGRFSPNRGKVGILVCRSVQDAGRVARSCRDTADDGRGFLLVLTDDDLLTLVREYVETNGGSVYSLLMQKFAALVN